MAISLPRRSPVIGRCDPTPTSGVKPCPSRPRYRPSLCALRSRSVALPALIWHIAGDTNLRAKLKLANVAVLDLCAYFRSRVPCAELAGRRRARTPVDYSHVLGSQRAREDVADVTDVFSMLLHVQLGITGSHCPCISLSGEASLLCPPQSSRPLCQRCSPRWPSRFWLARNLVCTQSRSAWPWFPC